MESDPSSDSPSDDPQQNQSIRDVSVSEPKIPFAGSLPIGHPVYAGKVVRFDDLSRCGDEIWIEHRGQLYRLRQTRHGKLVLTK